MFRIAARSILAVTTCSTHDRYVRWSTVTLVSALFCCCPPAAGADSGQSQRPEWRKGEGPFELGAGADLMISTGTACRSDGDLTSCSQRSFQGAYLASEWRLTEVWSLGALGAFHWSPDNDGASRSEWQGFFDARVYPFSPAALDPWLGALVGVMAVTDTLNDAPASGPRGATDYAPAGGLEAGVDFGLGPNLALRMTARGMLASFGEPPRLGQGAATGYRTAMWASLGLGVVWRPFVGSRSARYVASER